MNCFRSLGVWVVGLVCLAAGCAAAADGDAKLGEEGAVAPVVKIIPLDQIWAYGMPGTRDILTLDPDRVPQRPLGMRVGGPQSFISREGEKIAGPGFAVLGKGMEAWLSTHVELAEGQKPQDSFPLGSELSVVFFSHGFGQYVHIHRVERHGNVITIRYRFVPHRTKNFSSHFALIPVNGLQLGKVQVNIIRSPMDQKYVGSWKPISAEWERRVVCKSFSFLILENK